MILAVDYDGTLKQDGFVSEETLIKISHFRKLGHKFAIVTGRYLDGIRQEIDKYHIEFDYIVASNGAMITDNQYSILKSYTIDDKTTKELIDFVDRHNIPFCVLTDGYYVYYKNNMTRSLKVTIEFNHKLNKDEFYNLHNNIGGSFNGNSEKETDHIYELLTKEIKNICVVRNLYVCDITALNIDKAKGLETLKELTNESQIECMGDDFNDIPMIQAFNGYAVSNGVMEVRKMAKGEFRDVGCLIDHLLMK